MESSPCLAERRRLSSELAAVISPVEQSLTLPPVAQKIARLAVALDLSDVPTHGLPALDLPGVLLGQSPPHVVAAVPLEPAARVLRMDPSIPAPNRQRLAGVYPEIVQGAVSV